jgi:hypothetical protein
VGIGLEKHFLTAHNKLRKCQASTEENMSKIRRSPTGFSTKRKVNFEDLTTANAELREDHRRIIE